MKYYTIRECPKCGTHDIVEINYVHQVGYYCKCKHCGYNFEKDYPDPVSALNAWNNRSELKENDEMEFENVTLKDYDECIKKIVSPDGYSHHDLIEAFGDKMNGGVQCLLARCTPEEIVSMCHKYDKEKPNPKVGDIVRYRSGNELGVITKISKDMSNAYVMFRDGSSTLQKATNASPLFGRSGRFVIIGNKNIDDKLVKFLECLED